MKPITRLVAMVTGLVLVLNVTPSWGQIPNPTASDANANTAGGTGALQDVDETPYPGGGAENTAFGSEALRHTTTGSGNTAFGATALSDNTTGNFNTATGVAALTSNTGTHNTATGYAALRLNTTGRDNTATGGGALGSHTTGDSNTATGAYALLKHTTGDANTASGAQALVNNSTGILNTATGFQALNDNIDGSKNTAVGANALDHSTGNKNIAIGVNAGSNLTTGNKNIYLGSPGGDASESKTIRVGSAQTRTFIAGIADSAVIDGVPVAIDITTGQLGTAPPSSARYKQDIAAMGARSAGVLQLRPVTFTYREDASGTVRYGLIAEEVATVYPELVTRTATGEVQGVRYQELIPMLLNELQQQRQELAELRALVGKGHGTASLSR